MGCHGIKKLKPGCKSDLTVMKIKCLYERAWTISANDCDRLLAALGAQSELLAALGERVSGENAAELQSFLESAGIEFEAWSRIGD